MPMSLRPVLTFVSIQIVFVLTLTIALVSGRWPFVDAFSIKDNMFGDLGVLLHLADYLREHPTGNPYTADWSEVGMVPNYPLLVPRLLAILGLGVEHQLIIGVISALALSITIGLTWAYVSREQKLGTTEIVVIAMLASSSAPIMLLIERGNYDSWVLVLCMTAAFTLSRKFEVLTVALVSLASIIKLFPVALAVVLARSLSRGKRWLASLPVVLTIGYYSAFPIELAAIQSSTPRANWSSFGQFVIPGFVEEYRLISGASLLFLIWLTFHLASIAAAVFISRASRIDSFVRSLQSGSMKKELFTFGGTLAIATYLLGNSFDYRLAFLLPVLIATLAIDQGNKAFSRVLVCLISLVLVFSISSWQLSIIGDVIHGVLIALLALGVIQLLFVRELPERSWANWFR